MDNINRTLRSDGKRNDDKDMMIFKHRLLLCAYSANKTKFAPRSPTLDETVSNGCLRNPLRAPIWSLNQEQFSNQ